MTCSGKEDKELYNINAKNLGPIHQLEDNLSASNQNLIFALNGTGKSFLARAFYYLDLYGQGKDIENAPLNLVSAEAKKGEFSLKLDDKVLGSHKLNSDKNIVDSFINDDTIFHTFTTEFIQNELHAHDYKLKDKYQHRITVGRSNIVVDKAEKELAIISEENEKKENELATQFDSEKAELLSNDLKISKNMNEYKDLTFKSILESHTVKPSISDQSSLDSIGKQLKLMETFPDDAVSPVPVKNIPVNEQLFKNIQNLLKKKTTPKSVSNEIVKKIKMDEEFFRTGTNMFKENELQICPFCEQDTSNDETKIIIENYIKYFSEKEEVHKIALRKTHKELNEFRNTLRAVSEANLQMCKEYDNLKRFLPEYNDASLIDISVTLESLQINISSVLESLQSKENSLEIEIEFDENNTLLFIRELNEAIEKNILSVKKLMDELKNLGAKKKELKQEACRLFGIEFAFLNWTIIESIIKGSELVKTMVENLKKLKKNRPSEEAKSRIAETFKEFLEFILGDLYVFDPDSFAITRGEVPMKRNPQRTFSEGEKTMIAFCYFVACTHLKVQNLSDYKKLFFVFDDPVTSMSYNYIFSICQVLKDLRISREGKLVLFKKDDGKMSYSQPRILILTHSTYFVNICRNHGALGHKAAFLLQSGKSRHEISRLIRNLAPFQAQLQEVYNVAHGEEFKISTPNAIRSVIEAITQFCHPDKSRPQSAFIKFINTETEILIQGPLINYFSHGTPYDELFIPDSIKKACNDTLRVVEHFAPGQIELLDKSIDTKEKSK